jgi:hypothetical protein
MEATQLYRMRSVYRKLRYEVDEYLSTEQGMMKIFVVNRGTTCQIVEQDMIRYKANFGHTLGDCLDLIQGGSNSKLVDGFRIVGNLKLFKVFFNCCIFIGEGAALFT